MLNAHQVPATASTHSHPRPVLRVLCALNRTSHTHLARRCGGSWKIDVAEIDCTLPVFGGRLVFAFVALAACYLVVGTTMNLRRAGGNVSDWRSALPHKAQWAELAALVQDGLSFARGNRRYPHGTSSRGGESLLGSRSEQQHTKQDAQHMSAKRAKPKKKVLDSDMPPAPAKTDASDGRGKNLASPGLPGSDRPTGRWVHVPS